ncbi:hypothetical protein MSG28_003802 [Choristoneura fumiferana]|uniref:Uncharacterized protein n=1 Tax=Choristoneura fumiferana TaxID=7141 RepID=A0ACC0KGQ8_CHOFU|nr:hypothetical protein MSG28_003802 [Choristoneura fumiferana]
MQTRDGFGRHRGENGGRVVGPCARSAELLTTILLANPAMKQQCLHCCVSAWRVHLQYADRFQSRQKNYYKGTMLGKRVQTGHNNRRKNGKKIQFSRLVPGHFIELKNSDLNTTAALCGLCEMEQSPVEIATALLQFALVSLVGAVFPLAPLFAFFANVIHIRYEARMFLLCHRRPLLLETAGIGVWKHIIKVLTLLSVPANFLRVDIGTNDEDDFKAAIHDENREHAWFSFLRIRVYAGSGIRLKYYQRDSEIPQETEELAVSSLNASVLRSSGEMLPASLVPCRRAYEDYYLSPEIGTAVKQYRKNHFVPQLCYFPVLETCCFSLELRTGCILIGLSSMFSQGLRLLFQAALDVTHKDLLPPFLFGLLEIWDKLTEIESYKNIIILQVGLIVFGQKRNSPDSDYVELYRYHEFTVTVFDSDGAITSTYECQKKSTTDSEKPLLRRIRQETQRVSTR